MIKAGLPTIRKRLEKLYKEVDTLPGKFYIHYNNLNCMKKAYDTAFNNALLKEIKSGNSYRLSMLEATKVTYDLKSELLQEKTNIKTLLSVKDSLRMQIRICKAQMELLKELKSEGIKI